MPKGVTVVLRKHDDREGAGLQTKTVIEYTKAEDEAMAELELFNRRVYMVGLNRNNQNVPAQHIFPKLKSTNAIFKDAVTKTSRDFKNWKGRILKRIDTHMTKWVLEHKDEDVRETIDLKVFRTYVVEGYQVHWLSVCFSPLDPVAAFEDASRLGLQFFKCKS